MSTPNFCPDTHISSRPTYVDVAINLNHLNAQIESFFFWNKEMLFSQHFLCRPNFFCFLLTSDTWQLMREISKIPTRRYLGGQLETRNLLKQGKVHWFHTQLKSRFGILQSCKTRNYKFFTANRPLSVCFLFRTSVILTVKQAWLLCQERSLVVARSIRLDMCGQKPSLFGRIGADPDGGMCWMASSGSGCAIPGHLPKRHLPNTLTATHLYAAHSMPGSRPNWTVPL